MKAGYYPNLKQRHQLAKFMNIKEEKIVKWFNHKHSEQKSAAMFFKGELSLVKNKAMFSDNGKKSPKQVSHQEVR